MPTVKQYRDDPANQNRELLKNPSVQAILKTIRYAEGTAGDRGYNTRVGYSEFDDLSKKPGKKVFIPSINDFSSAEGAYQFLNSTWDGVSKKLGLKDFSPESQDLAAIELIKNRGALEDVLSNNLNGALTKLSGEWASLPTASGKSAYKNQNSKKSQDLSKVFFSNLKNPKQNKDVTSTTAVSQLEIPIISANFAGVSESTETEEKEDKQPIKEAEEVKRQTNEYNFLKDYQEQYTQQQEQQPIQIPTIDVEQTVNEVSQFVDSDITAQQGLRKGQLEIFPKAEILPAFNRPYTPSRPTLEISDNRKINATTGKPIDPNRDLTSGNYDQDTIKRTVLAANKYGVDPYTALAIGLQETGLGREDDNTGHIIGKHDIKFSKSSSAEEDFVKVLKEKQEYAKKLGIKDETTTLQAYNGLGKIYPETEQDYHGFKMKKIYGVDVPKEGIDMRKNPLYGKRIVDLRDNVLKQNPGLIEYVTSITPKINPFTGKEDKGSYIPQFQQGGSWQEKLANRPKKLTVAELIAENDARQSQQNEVQRDATSVVQPKLPKKLTKEQVLKVQKDLYENPFKPEGITSGDKTIDFLYNNDWLMDVPIVGGYIKDKAKEVANFSGGAPTVKKIGANDEDSEYSGDMGKSFERNTLLDQYFSDRPILKKSIYKPKEDYLEFLPSYSIKGNFNDRYYNELSDDFKRVIDEDIFKKGEYENFIKNKKNVYVDTNALSDLLEVDLGSHKVGAAWDKERNLPYVSISDAWDFEPKNYSKKWTNEKSTSNHQQANNDKERAFIQSYLMHKAGNPFKIYDRFYFDPKTKEYIPDSPQRYQQGGTAEEKDMQWLQDWYANRVIPNKEVNDVYQKQKNDYEDLSHAIPYPTYTGYIPTPKDWKGGRIEGMESADGSINLVSPPNETTGIHEYTHFVDRRLGDLPMERVHKSIVDQNVAPIEGINAPYIKDNYRYYTTPTEVHARVQELRKKAGFKPNQEIKEEDLNKFLKTYKGDVSGIEDLLNMTDTPHLIEILNTMAYTPKKGKDNVAQQGGKGNAKQKYTENELAFLSEIAIKDNNGQWTNPGKITEINSNQITMRGVDYPLLGISKQTGEKKIMKPNRNYSFADTKQVIEVPLFKK